MDASILAGVGSGFVLGVDQAVEPEVTRYHLV